MKLKILIFFLFYSGLIYSREQQIKKDSLTGKSNSDEKQNDGYFTFPSTYPSIDFLLGRKLLNNDFFNQLNTINNYKQNSPIRYFGIGVTGYDGTIISYSQVETQTIHIHDTISAKVSGYTINLMGGIVDLFDKARNADMLICLGGNIGRIKISDNPYINKKNAFLSPAIAIVPRVFIGRLVISARCSYEYDISRYKWINIPKSVNTVDLTKLNQRGLTIQFGIGIAL